MKLDIPYGKDRQILEIDESHLLAVVHPNKVKRGDESKILQKALENPVDSPPFADFIARARKPVFIVNDGTRPTPTATVLDILKNDISTLNANFIISTGVHRAPTEEEFDFIFGRHYKYLKDKVFVHDSKKDDDMVFVGKSSNGTEMHINKLAMESDKIIIIGSVEPHYFAGYTGGRKSFLPGVASYKTISQNHKFALNPEAQALSLDGNPVNEDMIDALKTIEDKDIFSIQTVLDRDRRIYAAFSGDINSSFYRAIDKANEVFAVKISEKADIVVSVAPYPMDVDLYQSQKAIDNGKLALKEGGILIMVSMCRTGIGPQTFYELMSSCDTPGDVMKKIESEFKLGYHKAAKMIEINEWASIWAVTDLEDEVLEKIFIRPFNKVQNAVDTAIKEIGKDATVLFMMDGSITVPIVD